MPKWLTYILLIIFLIGIFFLYGFAQHRYNTRRVQEMDIQFTGKETRMISKETVSNLLIQNLGNPLNQLNSTINLHGIENEIEQNPMIRNAEAFLVPDGALHIDVEQKVPIARITSHNGHRYMDDHGELMPVSSLFSARVLLVDGVETKQALESAYQIINYIKTDDFFSKQIIGMKRLDNGDFQLNTRLGAHKILFGKAEDIEQKFNKLKVFYKRMWEDEKLKEYKLLNIKYNKQVVCS